VIRVLQDTGFSLSEDLSALFSGTGSNYYILKKAEQGTAPAAIERSGIAVGELGTLYSPRNNLKQYICIACYGSGRKIFHYAI